MAFRPLGTLGPQVREDTLKVAPTTSTSVIAFSRDKFFLVEPLEFAES